MFLRIHAFQGPGFSGSKLFRVQVFQDPGFSGSVSRVRVQVLEVALFITSDLFISSLVCLICRA